MENLIPPILSAARAVRWQLQAGKGMKVALRTYLESDHSAFARKLRRQLALFESGGASESFPNHLQQSLWEVIERGFRGEPVLSVLDALEREIEAQAAHEVELHLAALPVKMLIPLLFLQFPAYLILLLGPVLRELTSAMGG